MIFKFYISVAVAVIILQLYMIQKSGCVIPENTGITQTEMSLMQAVTGQGTVVESKPELSPVMQKFLDSKRLKN